MMKVSGFCVLFLVFVGITFTFFNFFTPNGSTLFPDLVAVNSGGKTKLIAISRKLKENASSIRSNNKGDQGNVTLDDYNPIDPVPSSSKASLTPGPIEHGTPLMPYIPKPSPPSPNHPKPGDSK